MAHILIVVGGGDGWVGQVDGERKNPQMKRSIKPTDVAIGGRGDP